MATYTSASSYSGVGFLVMNVLETCLDDWIGLYDIVLPKFPREKMKQFNMQTAPFSLALFFFMLSLFLLVGSGIHLGFLSSLLWSTISRAHRAKWLSFLWFFLSCQKENNDLVIHHVHYFPLFSGIVFTELVDKYIIQAYKDTWLPLNLLDQNPLCHWCHSDPFHQILNTFLPSSIIGGIKLKDVVSSNLVEL